MFSKAFLLLIYFSNKNPFMKVTLSQKFIAELFGTLVLVLMGCGSAVLAGKHVGFLGISFAFGLSVVSMAYAIGNISGCHINPAITISMLATGKISGKDAAAYIIAQIIGAIAGAGILYLVAQGKADYSLAANGLGQNGVGEGSPDGYNLVAGLIAEIVLTTIFLVVIHGSTSKRYGNVNFAGLAIGLSLTLIHIVGIPVTGVSVNPARSIGPALFVGGAALSSLWVFIVGPVVGGLIGAGIWKLMDKETASSY
jgi:aquaporin Z